MSSPSLLTALLIALAPAPEVSDADVGWVASELVARGHTVTLAPSPADVRIRWRLDGGRADVELDTSPTTQLVLSTTRPTWRLELSHRLGTALDTIPAAKPPPPNTAHLMLEPRAATPDATARTQLLAHALLTAGVPLAPSSPNQWHVCVASTGSAAHLSPEPPAAGCGPADLEIAHAPTEPTRDWTARVVAALEDARATPTASVTETPDPPTPSPARPKLRVGVGVGAGWRGEVDPMLDVTLGLDVAGGPGATLGVRALRSESGGVSVDEVGVYIGSRWTARLTGPLSWRAGVGVGAWRHAYRAFGREDTRTDPSLMLDAGLELRLGQLVAIEPIAEALWTGRAISHTADGDTLWSRDGWSLGAGVRVNVVLGL